jgi:hypothetical protein
MNTHIEPDAVLEELWAIREQIMRASNYDIDRMREAEHAKTAQWEREGFTFVRKPLPSYLRDGSQEPKTESPSTETPSRQVAMAA